MKAPHSKNLIIRPATQNDLSALAQVCSLTFIETYDGKGKDRPPEMVHEYVREKFTPNALAKDLSNSSISLYIALVEEQVIGYFKLIEENPPAFVQPQNLQLLERIYVLGRYQGLGFGKLLLKKAEAIAKENQSDGIWLGVWEENKRAIEFYLKQGYLKAGSQNWEFDYNGFHYIDIDDVMMRVF